MKLLILLGLFIVVFYKCFYNLGIQPLERWDEQTNAQVVSELVSKPLSTILYLNGQPFFEKPPLWYFLTAEVTLPTGINNTTLRLISAISGFLLILLVFYIAKVWFGEIAAIASTLILLTTNHLFVTNPGGFFSTHHIRSADGDILQILFMVAAVYCLSPSYKKTGFYAGCFLGALAVLTKGPLGLLPIVIWYIHQLLIPPNQRLMPTIFLRGIAIFFLFVLPWHLYMYMLFGNEFLKEYAWYHLLSRTLQPIEGHNQPWWYYFQMLTHRTVFLSVELLDISVLYVMKSKKQFVEYKNFSIITIILFVLTIATLSQTKLAWYILPIYPFTALAIGNLIQQIWEHFVARTKKKTYARIYYK